jgi:hypothetical protein
MPAMPLDIGLDKNREFAITQGIGVKVAYAKSLRDKIGDRCSVCTSVSI